MTDADFDFAGYDRPQPGSWIDLRQVRGGLRKKVNLAAAVVSCSLVVGGVVWSYDLAVREAQGVPVIQAMAEPMRVAPTDPGGQIVDYQGLAVNNVAAVGVAAPMPERLILAPRPVVLTDEDGAGRRAVSAGPPIPVESRAAIPSESLALAAAPLLESADPIGLAVDAALAEALGEVDANLAEPPVVSDAEAGPAPEGALLLSPRPKPRPLPVEPVLAAVTSGSVDGQVRPKVVAVEVDPTTIRTGTRLVQFGAFDTPDEARAEWARLEDRYGDLLAGKGLVLQPAESGGRSFIRLRAHGFEDEADARRFCAAFSADGNICIPVPQR